MKKRLPIFRFAHSVAFLAFIAKEDYLNSLAQ